MNFSHDRQLIVRRALVGERQSMHFLIRASTFIGKFFPVEMKIGPFASIRREKEKKDSYCNGTSARIFTYFRYFFAEIEILYTV